MQTLRKKTSPLKYKNETTRFLGDGVSFKAKLIGILEVSEARGDRMCQEALSDLKMAIRAAGEHKQRITINIAIDGLRLRDEKTGDSLYHHPVHKISFIAQDMTDSRAFGYIFGSPDTGHRFFGIKTDKAASQVVIAMRDLFQVVFALKKKEIELAKQHLDKTRYTSSPLFSDSSISSTKTISHEPTKSTSSESKAGPSSDSKTGGTAVADLVDLELELNSLQQGLNQMERITPSADPFGSKDDPFGDSFTSYTKPILPPPPSSGRERASRTSETSSLFSPRTAGGSVDSNVKSKKEFTFSHDFSSSHEEPSSGDWFTPSGGNSILEEPALVPEASKVDRHEMTKQEILSQFDVFTELDPLELKNPPKKVLNDLVSQTQAPKGNDFTTDPFGEDPFVKEDPFSEADFTKQDPFETEFGDFNKRQSETAKSPKPSIFDRQTSLSGTGTGNSPRNLHFTKQNTFDVHFDHSKPVEKEKLMQLHENPSLDMSSESECAPEPPPRPANTLAMQIRPPPLPPKKQNDLSVKPPPRPPHTEDSHYDYMDNYETAPNSLEFIKNVDKSPPLPVPARKSRFESDFIPERPSKKFNNNINSSEEDYLTPISLPPPQKSLTTSKRQQHQQQLQVTVASILESKPTVTTTSSSSVDDLSVEGLDITLSQLTLTGLNELAAKLDIPTNQLSNMTLVQLTSYLSNFIKNKGRGINQNQNETPDTSKISNKFYSADSGSNNDFANFKADFAANFNNLNNPQTSDSSYDRYAVFRELMNEEIKQTKIDTEPEELKEEKAENIANNITLDNSNVNNINNVHTIDSDGTKDKYAALREIVETELKMTEQQKDDDNNKIDKNIVNEESIEDTSDIVKIENKFNDEEKEKPPKYNLIEYNTPLDISAANNKPTTPLKSPKSPIGKVKSPLPIAITEIIQQNNTRLTSGSLSDVVSGSSPEVDNTASNSEVGKKGSDAAAESWAIFDQGNVSSEVVKEKQVQSEEGVSPWSSDSKEFGNGSPPDWRRGDSGSDSRWPKRRGRKEQEGWWDTSAEPEMQQYPPNRRSTDSYEEEFYDCYERPRRRKQAGYPHAAQAAGAGGHSSSSRDVSPWEEEPRRRETRERPGWASRHPRQYSFEKRRRHTDSWDEEDDYEYEDEHVNRFHRHGRGDHDSGRWADDWVEERRHRRRREGDRERWCCPDWEQGEQEKPPPVRYGSRWGTPEGLPPGMWRDRKHDERYYSRESQESPWEDDEYSNETEESPAQHYVAAKRNWKRPSSASEMDRKTGEIKSRHYLGTGGSDGERDRRYKPGRRSRSRDSQFSEPAHRHKPDAGPPIRGLHRSKQYPKPQFDNEFSETPPKKAADNSKSDHSNKKSATLTKKKTKESPKTEEKNIVSTFPRKSSKKSMFENDFVPSEDSRVNPRSVGAKFNFDDFERSEAESPVINTSLKAVRQQSMFEKREDVSEFVKDSFRQRSLKESSGTRLSPRLQISGVINHKPKSLFEDDFSPSDRTAVNDNVPEDNSISSIKEEIDPSNEQEDSFNSTNKFVSRKKKFQKHRLSSTSDKANLKKSESVNIFSRENDPFDDDFFCESAVERAELQLRGTGASPRTTDLKWTDDFEDFDIEGRNK